MRLLYSFFIRMYSLAVAMYSIVNTKAALWINGRKKWKQKLQGINFNDHQVLWFHCASLGEFEQGRPLIEEINGSGKYKVLLTFFSPSGYELKKNYQHAQWVMYLPADTAGNAGYFIDMVKPKAVFFIKYEFWFNYLIELKKRAIPVYLVSGIFRENQYFFTWYGKWAVKQLNAFSYFFVQNQESHKLLNRIGYKNVAITGDTRFDRVLQIRQTSKKYEQIDAFVNDDLVIVAGSTYAEDEKILKSAFAKLLIANVNVRLIVAPHVVTANRIAESEITFGMNDSSKFSQENSNHTNKKILIIDNIGMLSSLYSYADVAYIGGGLGKGIHNTLEAAVYGIPLIFGPNFHKFEEAGALVGSGAAVVINNQDELYTVLLNLLSDGTERKRKGALAGSYVKAQQGAVVKIIQALKEKNILL